MNKSEIFKKNLGKFLSKLSPLLGLIFLVSVYLILGSIKDYNIAYGMKAIINQSVVVAVVATGAVFIYSLGSFDISLGASVAVSALLGGMIYLRTESIALMFLTSIVVAVVISLTNSVLASIFNLPVFVTTIAMLSVLNALVSVLISANGTGSQIKVPAIAVKELDNLGVKIFVLITMLVVAGFVYNITKIGRQLKYIGGNPVCAKLSGISDKKLAIIAFVITGIAVGIGAILSIIYAPTLTKDTGTSVGMDVIIAIVFGGMPVSGGAKSKVSAAVVGAFSMVFLSQIMTMLNLNVGIGQMVKAGVFILVVFLASGKNRTGLLTR